MNLSQPELQRLLELLLTASMDEQSLELHEKLLSKLSIEFAMKTIEKDPSNEVLYFPSPPPSPSTAVSKHSIFYDPATKITGTSIFNTSTARTSKLLKVTESDLRALRVAKELREGFHYITGRRPRPSAIWYDLERTCQQLHEVSYKKFSEPGFDVEENTRKRVARAFEAARRNQKK